MTPPIPTPSNAGLGHKIMGGLSILAILDVAYFINAMDRQVFPVILPEVRAALDVGPSQIGLLATIFTLGMGLAGIPAGYLTDKFGRKNMILAGLAVFSVTTALQAFAFGWLDMAAYRIISGLGEGVQNAALYAAAGSYFYLNRGLAIGTLSAAYGLGAFTGPVVGQALVDLTGHWQTPLITFGLLGAIIYAVIWYGVPRAASEYGADAGDDGKASEMGVTATGKLVNRTIVCSAIAAAGAGFALYAYLGLYPTFLREVHGFSPGQASWTASMFGIGALASVLGGHFADRVDQRRLNVFGLVGLLVTGVLLFTLSAPQAVHIVLSLLVGVFFTGVVYTNTSALMQRSVGPSLVGRAQGVFLAAVYIPASVSGAVFAVLVESFGWAVGGAVVMAVPCAIGLVGMAALGPNYRETTPTEHATGKQVLRSANDG
ncbi:MFS transporter [Mycobacterium sp. NPDC003449]